ncbi:MAG: presenilin family intramembrane aspartyl protease [archaeon]|jgi:presenilin-like A22 family membrane protease
MPRKRKTVKPRPAAKKQKIKSKNSKRNRVNSRTGKKFNANAFALLFLIFAVTEILGLIVAQSLLKTIQVEPVFGQTINDASNAIYLVGMILATTALLILLLRMKRKRNFLWIIEALAVFSTSTIVFGTIIGDYSILVAILLVLLRQMNRKKLWLRNLTCIILIAGAGAYLGISLGTLPILIFIIALAIYDIIAVFGTKHMVTIGKEVSEGNFAFTIAIPTKEHKFELGNGDLVVPLMVASSIMANGPFKNNYTVAAACLLASFIGLAISIETVSRKKIALPALPPQTALILIVIAATYLLGA